MDIEPYGGLCEKGSCKRVVKGQPDGNCQQEETGAPHINSNQYMSSVCPAAMISMSLMESMSNGMLTTRLHNSVSRWYNHGAEMRFPAMEFPLIFIAHNEELKDIEGRIEKHE